MTWEDGEVFINAVEDFGEISAGMIGCEEGVALAATSRCGCVL